MHKCIKSLRSFDYYYLQVWKKNLKKQQKQIKTRNKIKLLEKLLKILRGPEGFLC